MPSDNSALPASAVEEPLAVLAKYAGVHMRVSRVQLAPGRTEIVLNDRVDAHDLAGAVFVIPPHLYVPLAQLLLAEAVRANPPA